MSHTFGSLFNSNERIGIILAWNAIQKPQTSRSREFSSELMMRRWKWDGHDPEDQVGVSGNFPSLAMVVNINCAETTLLPSCHQVCASQYRAAISFKCNLA
eukprot:TRINITY_DN23580_c0_g1_i1.p2 TRINITY_DN23580_c0_g1~~TRINITY_DN23580_c0_g1_i1.p2  ORF type:complete len:101 (+),score=6.52 TRINITY_DN23580_c0_g1_i1:311-613(+)